MGPIQVSADKTRTLPLPPIVGGIALVGGIVLLVMGNKQTDNMQYVSITRSLI